MSVFYEGTGNLTLSFERSGNLAEGQVCKLTDNGEVGSCAEGDALLGVVETVRGDLCGVVLRGAVRVAYSGTTAPTVGYAKLSADGDGGVQADAEGRDYLVLSVDTTAETVILFL